MFPGPTSNPLNRVMTVVQRNCGHVSVVLLSMLFYAAQNVATAEVTKLVAKNTEAETRVEIIKNKVGLCCLT